MRHWKGSMRLTGYATLSLGSYSHCMLQGVQIRQNWFTQFCDGNLWRKKKKEIWDVFRGKLLRFSLREFHIVTCLKWGKIPSDEDVEDHKNREEFPIWKKLFGTENLELIVHDIIKILKDNIPFPGTGNTLKCWYNLPLATASVKS